MLMLTEPVNVSDMIPKKAWPVGKILLANWWDSQTDAQAAVWPL